MAALDNQTKINPTTSFYGTGSGSQTISTLNNLSSVSAHIGSFSTLTGGEGFFSTLSSGSVLANLIDTNFISATTIDIDGQLLTATPTELLLNGIPLATTSNLSSIADWALDPAISTVQMDNNDLVDARNIQSLTATISSLYADEIVAINQTVISTLVVEYTVSSLFADFQDLQVSTLGCDQATIAEITMISDDGTSELLLNPPGLGGSIGFQQFYQISSPLFSTGTSMLFGSNGGFSLGAANGLLLDSGNGEIGVGDILISSSSNVYGMGHIEALNLNVSSINGAEFTQSSITVEVIGVSTLIADSIQGIGAEIREALVSTLQFNPSFNPNLDVNLGLGSLFGNLAGAATGVFGVLVGGAALGTGIAALTQGRQTRNINSNTFELINGTTQLQVSSLGAPFESVYRFVSSGDASEIFISTQNAPGYAVRSMSDPLNTVSSPSTFVQSFGQWVPLPIIEPSTLTNPNPVFSTITLNENAGARGGAPYLNSGSGISTFEIYETTAPQYSGALRANQINFSYAGLTSNDYTRDVLLYVFDTGANTRLRVGASNFTPQNLAYVSDIPPQISSFQTASISTLTVQTVNGGTPYTTANPPPVVNTFTNLYTQTLDASTINMTNGAIGGVSTINGLPASAYTTGAVEYISTLFTSTIRDIASSITLQNANLGFISLDISGDIQQIAPGYISLQAQSSGTVMASQLLSRFSGGLFSNFAEGPMFFAASTITMISNRVRMDVLSTGVIGVGNNIFSTSVTTGSSSQPAGRLVMGGNDLDLGQNDLWCQQVRLGANTTGGSAATEVIWYAPDGSQRGMGLASGDLTVRLQSTINSGTNNGYILDTQINRPFFSTINGQTNLMASFPSTSLNTIGVSTLSVLPPLNYFASAYSSNTQPVTAANTATNAMWETTSLNTGGFTIGQSTLVVPVAGTYEITVSFQFATTSGGTNQAQFWLTKNGSAVAQTNSIVSIVNNGDTLGTISIFETAAVGDAYGFQFYSSDANMTALAVAAGATPAIPSVIVNIKRLG